MEKLESQSKRVGFEALAHALKHGVGGHEDVVALGFDGLGW